MSRAVLMSWLAVGSLAMGALFAVYAGSLWQPDEVYGHTAWALLPFTLLMAAYLSCRLLQTTVRHRMESDIAKFAISVAGAVFYADVLFIHIDAQGAIAILMIPLVQTALCLVATVVIFFRGAFTRSHQGHAAETTETVASNTPRHILAAMSIIVFVPSCAYWLQGRDAETIKVVQRIQAHVAHACRLDGRFPSRDALRRTFPHLAKEPGWFLFSDDRRYLKLQYPVKWQNKSAPGSRQISPFTGTVYAYTIEFKC